MNFITLIILRAGQIKMNMKICSGYWLTRMEKNLSVRRYLSFDRDDCESTFMTILFGITKLLLITRNFYCIEKLRIGTGKLT